MIFGASLNFQNANGEVQIDQSFVNLEVFAEGEVTSTGGGYNALHLLTYSGIIRPMVFVKLDMNRRYFFGPTKDTAFYMSSNHLLGEKIAYKIAGFRADLTAPASGWGMAIMRPGTQDIVFASSRKNLRIINSLQIFANLSWTPLRSGDWRDFSTGGDGLTHWEQWNHPTKPIPADTYWLATMTGLRPRPGSNNSSLWALERKSTTRIELEGRDFLTRDNRLLMELPESTGYRPFTNWLIAG